MATTRIRKPAGAHRILMSLLRELATEGTRIRRSGGECWYLICKEGEASLPERLVRMLMARDALDRVGDEDEEYILSPIGHLMLRRLKAGPDPFRAQHQLIERRHLGAEIRRAVEVNAGETPLGWLARRKGPDGQPFLDRDELAAGEKLRVDFTFANLTPRVTQAWDFSGAGSRGHRPEQDPCDARMAAKARFHRALDAVGPGLSDILVPICCHLQGLEEAERGLGWPVRSGKVVLKIALQRLAFHYRIGPVGGTPIRSHREAP